MHLLDAIAILRRIAWDSDIKRLVTAVADDLQKSLFVIEGMQRIAIFSSVLTPPEETLPAFGDEVVCQ